MPQLILEYTSNVEEKATFPTLFNQFHQILSETLPTSLTSCKSRAIERANYHIGDGNPTHAFVHINLKVMPGRDMDTLQRVGSDMMEILKQHFSVSLEKLNLQLTIEIGELQKTYFKYSKDNDLVLQN